MKRVLVIVKYEAYVPEDMTVDQLENNIDEWVRSEFDNLGVSAEDYQNEENSWVIFNLEDVMVGTSCMISIGND